MKMSINLDRNRSCNSGTTSTVDTRTRPAVNNVTHSVYRRFRVRVFAYLPITVILSYLLFLSFGEVADGDWYIIN